ncbi:hypothetical protein NDU88_000689 [Pleurodeles waltl]|uniref:Uncharacterized protein n=1 Tax=Pleurodeles waltl TaxID=8319 RepID=A0AAV7SX37_PLEWA|nr:hypothetical protein NDU88_000689 [Pleurodeles waltl]
MDTVIGVAGKAEHCCSESHGTSQCTRGDEQGYCHGDPAVAGVWGLHCFDNHAVAVVLMWICELQWLILTAVLKVADGSTQALLGSSDCGDSGRIMTARAPAVLYEKTIPEALQECKIHTKHAAQHLKKNM